VGSALQTVDRGRLMWRQASTWMAAHPVLVTATVVAVVVWRPRAVWRLARGAYGVWQDWVRLKAWSEGLRAGPPAAR
jgi:glutathione S-transferase